MAKFYIHLFISLYVCSLVNPTLAQKDTTMQQIDLQSLLKLVQNTPIDSPDHGQLISRAYVSDLAQIAYEQYTKIWQKYPHNPYANLRRGGAAENYWQYATRPDVHKLSLTSPLSHKLFQTAETCLANAQQEAPLLIQTNLAYGYFLFWHGDRMSDGVSFMKKALSINAKNAVAHTMLGDAYAEHSGNIYDPKKAAEELTLATSLDSSAAFPHWRLVRVYLDLHQYHAAQDEIKAYLKLAPPSAADSPGVKIFETEVSRHLSS